MKHEKFKLKNGSEITVPIAENYRDCLILAQSDLYRIYGRKISFPKIILRAFFTPFASVMFWFRLCAHTHGIFYWPARIIYKITSFACKIDIACGTKIGYGFYIAHRMGTLINRKTIIGNNVSVSHFVNIGTTFSRPAKIADNVWIAPMVCLVEDVEIGANARIGAGAVVTKDVPEHTTAAGVPAKVISQTGNSEWHCWKWENKK